MTQASAGDHTESQVSAPPLDSSPAASLSEARRGSGAGALVGLALVIGLSGLMWGAWEVLSPRRRLDESTFLRLASAGRYDDAEGMLREFAEDGPEGARARFLLAQLLVERSNVLEPEGRIEAVREAIELLDTLESVPATGPADSAAIRLHYRATALRSLKRWDEAEATWLEALRIDPKVPEAGFVLLDLYYVEGRKREARELALRLFESEPDPRDRALIMLGLLFHDAVKPDAASVVPILEGVVSAEPDGVHAVVAMGKALIRDSQLEPGVALLESNFERAWASQASDDAKRAAVEGLLAGLDLASRAEAMPAVFSRIPEPMRNAPEFARYRGIIAQEAKEWTAAASAFKEARAYDPTDVESLVRLARALRFAGEADEADAADRALAAYRGAQQLMLGLHDEASATTTLGVTPHGELCERIAAAYGEMGREPEVGAWRLIGVGSGGRARR